MINYDVAVNTLRLKMATNFSRFYDITALLQNRQNFTIFTFKSTTSSQQLPTFHCQDKFKLLKTVFSTTSHNFYDKLLKAVPSHNQSLKPGREPSRQGHLFTEDVTVTELPIRRIVSCSLSTSHPYFSFVTKQTSLQIVCIKSSIRY